MHIEKYSYSIKFNTIAYTTHLRHSPCQMLSGQLAVLEKPKLPKQINKIQNKALSQGLNATSIAVTI